VSDTTFRIVPDETGEVQEEQVVLTPEQMALLEQRRANIAKARLLRGKAQPAPPPPKNKGGRPPNNPRPVSERTVEDVAYTGIAANPGPAERSAPSREAQPEEVVTRVRRDHRDSGWADLPKHLRKSGWDYEWKTIRVYNEPVDPGEMLEVRNAGWRPEKAINWPDLVEPGSPPDAPIERRGQRLYGRPMRLSVEARQEDLQAAYEQQRDKTMAAASGRSATRGEEGIPSGRGVRSIPISVEIEGLAG